jgi:pyruvate/2-oxoglutarate dehydrogenase complex dihydrolipoamide acyltransferase (E2) component
VEVAIEQSQNQEQGQKATLHPQDPNARRDKSSAESDPDVLLDSPQLNLDGLELAIEDLDLANILKIGNVKVNIDGLESQLLLEVRLRKIVDLVNQVLSSVEGSLNQLSGLLNLNDDPGILRKMTEVLQKGEKVTKTHSLTQEIQEQTVQSAQDFYSNSLGQLKSQLENDRSDLENLLEQLPESQEKVRSQIQELVDSYENIENALDEAAEGQGVDEAVSGAMQQAQYTAEHVTDQAQDAEEGQVADQAGHAADDLVPDAQLLGETTNEAGQTVQRTVNDSGDIIETTLDESGNLLEEDITGKLTDLPVEEEYIDEEGQTVRTVEDESGTLVQLTLGEDGSILDLEIPCGTETEETTEEEQSGTECADGGEQEEGPNATQAAMQKAEQLGVDLSQIEGSGAEGRITVRDVVSAANNQG